MGCCIVYQDSLHCLYYFLEYYFCQTQDFNFFKKLKHAPHSKILNEKWGSATPQKFLLCFAVAENTAPQRCRTLEPPDLHLARKILTCDPEINLKIGCTLLIIVKAITVMYIYGALHYFLFTLFLQYFFYTFYTIFYFTLFFLIFFFFNLFNQ